MDLEKVIIELKKTDNYPFAQECVKIINSKEIIIDDETLGVVGNLKEVYNNKLKIQTKVVKKQTVLGYEFLLDQLEKFDNEIKIRRIIIIGAEFGFIIFKIEESDNENVIAVLKSFNVSLAKYNHLAKVYKERGYPVYFKRFIKGVKENL